MVDILLTHCIEKSKYLFHFNLQIILFIILALVPARNMSGHHLMSIKETRWQWTKFKDLIHYYVLVGVIPLTLLVTYINVFVGPAKLAPIPEGYRPKHWEYYQVSYFIRVRNISYCSYVIRYHSNLTITNYLYILF